MILRADNVHLHVPLCVCMMFVCLCVRVCACVCVFVWLCGLLGMRHGKGTMQYASGDVYRGDWKWGLRHGEGKLDYQFLSTSVHVFVQRLLINAEASILMRVKTYPHTHAQALTMKQRGGTAQDDPGPGGRNTVGEKLKAFLTRTMEPRRDNIYQGEWQADARHGKGIKSHLY
jgi:hypothetical protein